MFKRGLLGTCEIAVYFAVYIVYITIGLYKIYALRDRIIAVTKFEFASGWETLNRPRDDGSDELENFNEFIATNWPWYALHICQSSLTRWRWPQYQSFGNALLCAIALYDNLKATSLALVLSLLMSFYLATTHWPTKKLTWALAGAWMAAINLIKNSRYCVETLGYTEYFTLIIISSWSLLRCLSYSLTRINDRTSASKPYGLREFLGYTLYFPCLCYGPFISFKRYMSRRQESQPLASALGFGWSLTRIVILWFLMQYALHYLYIHYMSRQVATIALIGSVFWQHAAGYFMGQFFFLYYVITYGLGIAFAHYDGLNPPHKPRCIGRIHFYSDMWKYFDEGLYEFLFRHIYAEICGKQSSAFVKFFATAVTFGFVFVWHGCYTYVLIWSVLNFVCLAAEKCFKLLVSAPSYKRWTLAHLGPMGSQRLYALLATQLFIPAAFSNVYFISGREVGDFLMRGAYLSGIGNYLALCFCSYCFFQCSEYLLSKLNRV